MSTYSNNSPRVNRYTVAVSPEPREKVKMGFFRRKFAEWSKRAWDDSNNNVAIKSETMIDVEPQLNFKIYPATGGYIMEFRRYDRKTDRYDNQLYVISKENADIGESVARIVNMEMMK